MKTAKNLLFIKIAVAVVWFSAHRRAEEDGERHPAGADQRRSGARQ